MTGIAVPTPPSFLPLSVVIPAHNEEAVIGRCLRTLTAGAEPGELEVIVVCNGCTDRTAEVARAALADVVVVELAEAGKAGALTAGDRRASRFPRVYLDADIEVTVGALRTVADALAGGALCAAPRPEFVVEGRPWAVRAFYRVWAELPYVRGAMVGSGVYALAAAGRQRFGDFPELTADDQFVMQLFAEDERVAVGGERFRLHTPRRLRGLVQMRRRVYRGNRELAASGLAGQDGGGRPWAALADLARRPTWWPAVAVYVAVNLVGELASRRSRGPAWERDDSARGPAPGAPTVGYVTSRYPAVSHTFVLREIAAVRAAGVAVESISVQRAGEADLLSEADRAEAARTFAIRPITAPSLLAAHLRIAVRHPRAWVETLRATVADAPPGRRGALWQVFYFAQAVVAFAECQRRGVRHLHAHFANVAADVAWIAAGLGRRIDPDRPWTWSLSMHGPTEFFDAARYNLARKAEAADLVICISDFCRSQMMSFADPAAWSKMEVIHTGTDLERYRPPEPVAEVPDGPLRILSVGRLAPVKGQTLLLDAVHDLHGRGVDVRLVLVGGGPIADELAGQVDRLGLGGIVTLAGPVGQDEMPDLYRSADVFCLSSFAEGVPVVLMEAMATGLPVVSTNVNGIPELIRHGREGLLVPPGRADLIADALGELVAPEVRARLGAAGRAKVAADFDVQACGAQVADSFRRLLGSTC